MKICVQIGLPKNWIIKNWIPKIDQAQCEVSLLYSESLSEKPFPLPVVQCGVLISSVEFYLLIWKFSCTYFRDASSHRLTVSVHSFYFKDFTSLCQHKIKYHFIDYYLIVFTLFVYIFLILVYIQRIVFYSSSRTPIPIPHKTGVIILLILV